MAATTFPTTDHQHNESIAAAAIWLRSMPWGTRPRPLIPEIRRLFGLTTSEAIAAITEAGKTGGADARR